MVFSYPVSGGGEWVSGEGCPGGDAEGWSLDDDSLLQSRTVMVLPAASLPSAIDTLSSLLT